MKINLILAPEQAPAELLALQTLNPDKFFYLGKESQLAGTNVLIIDAPDMVTHFKRPMLFNSIVTVGHLSGDVIHLIAFQTKDRNDELIAQLVPENAILAQNSNGKSDYMLWSFWPDHKALGSFLNSDKFNQMKKLMKNPYTTSYIHVNSAQQLSLTHQMRGFDDKTWWG